VKFVSTKIGFDIYLKIYNEKNLKDVIYNNNKNRIYCDIYNLLGATETCFILNF